MSLSMTIVGVWQGNIFSGKARAEAEKLIDADLNHITESVYNLVRAQEESVQQKVNFDLNVARHILNLQGGVSVSRDSIKWNATNQFTKLSKSLELPKLMIGNKWLGKNKALSIETPVVDMVKRLVGGTATIFQRMDKQGNMLRVATNVENLDGTRAIGTYIPDINPDGTPNPVISAVMRGETYRGLAFVVNAWYVSAYEPIFDHQGEIIGVLYVGVKQENIASLRQAIMQVKIGETGYVFVLGGKGEDKGQYIISKNGQRDGENIWEEKDSSGNFIVQNIVNKAINLKPGEFATTRYFWRNPGEQEPRGKIARIVYYEPWDWVIGASVYEDELQKSLFKLTDGYRTMIYSFGTIAFFAAVLGGFFTWLYATRIMRPLIAVTDEAQRLTNEDFPRLLNAMDAVTRGDLTTGIEIENRPVGITSNDEIGTLAQTFNSMNNVLYTVGNAFTLMVANLRELTNRLEENVQERTAELSESKRRLSDILEFFPDATLVIDNEGKVTAWNRAMEVMTGVPACEILGKGDHEYSIPFYGQRRPILIDIVLNSMDDPALEQRYSNIRRVGDALVGEAVTPSLPGGAKFLSATASLLKNSHGEIIGAVESIRDRTELKLTEDRLKEYIAKLENYTEELRVVRDEHKKAKEDAESANRAKSSFLANMSHEIRTPMNAILGFAQLLMRDPMLTAQQRENLEIINRSGEHLLFLINDILEMSKIEANRITIRPVVFDLHAMLGDIEMMFKMRADSKQIHFDINRQMDLMRWILADDGKLRQILINLISNAIKFTEEGGVTVTVGRGRTDGGQLLLKAEVRDTGMGINKDELEKLFTAFGQTTSGVTAGGTGLGLVISRTYARLMGGDLTVSSAPDKGTVFSFSIPVEEANEGQSQIKASSLKVIGLMPGQQKNKVLIVDDFKTNRRLLVSMLVSAGFEIREAENGQEAVEVFMQWTPDIVLMDMAMPVMDGYEAIRRIRSAPAGEDVAIIAVTASVFEDEKHKIEECGADDHLGKPFKEADLFEVIRVHTGIEYRYDAPEVVGIAEEPFDMDEIRRQISAEISPEIIRQLHDATVSADLDTLNALLDGLAESVPALSLKLRAMAARYDYDLLLTLFSSGAL